MADEKEMTPEEMILELQRQLAEALTANEQLENAKAQLENNIAEVTKLAKNFEACNEKLSQAADVLESNNAALAKRNAELETEIDEAVKKIQLLGNPSFKLEGAEYEILVKKANVPGFGEVTAADILASPELQAKLVHRKSGAIKQVL